MQTDWLIVGAGLTGATLAERLAAGAGQRVLVVDRRDHIGGNVYDEYNEAGILIHRYGPHIFHTNSPKVWQYLSRFTAWRPYMHHVLGLVDGQYVPIPFNLNSLAMTFPPSLARRLEAALIRRFGFGAKIPILQLRQEPEGDLRLLADYVYAKVFRGYTVKQWGVEPEDLDPSVTARVPIHLSRDNRYFQDTYQGIPAHGYTAMVRRMLRHPNIRVLLGADFRDLRGEVQWRYLVFTGPIDEFFDYAHGRLPYRSLRFEVQTLDEEYHQPVGTINYPCDHDYTRITEQKRLTGQVCAKTSLVVEYPEPYEPGRNEPYYPVPQPANHDLYKRYQQEAAELQGRVFFAGRLADYRYYNMDQAVARALSLFEKEISPRLRGAV